MIELRPYQLEIARAVMNSVTNGKGYTFSVEIARQGGKNELSAQMEVALLVWFALEEGNLIKMMRLRQRLADRDIWKYCQSELGYMIRFEDVRAIFLSADVQSNVVGNTAHFLLEIDESQDVSKDKYTKEFKPMGATTNVTTVHYGTTWDDSTLLEEVKQTNLELEKKDGVRRHFSYDWHEVAKYNPNYARYVEGERQRLGEHHPLFLTQYCLQPIKGGGRFFSDVQRTLLQGVHELPGVVGMNVVIDHPMKDEELALQLIDVLQTRPVLEALGILLRRAHVALSVDRVIVFPGGQSRTRSGDVEHIRVFQHRKL